MEHDGEGKEGDHSALWMRRTLLPRGLIAFRRDNISALISLCGAQSDSRDKLVRPPPVYLCSLDSLVYTLYYLSISSAVRCT